MIRLSDDALQELRERDEVRGGDGDDDGDGDAPARTRVKLVTDDVPQAFSHFSLVYPMHPACNPKHPGCNPMHPG